MPHHGDPRSMSELFSDAVSQFTRLLRNEVAIARTEVTAKATEAATGAGILIGGAVLVVPAFVLILMALAAWFVELGLRASLANLLAGVIGLAISGAVAYFGMQRLSPERLKPTATMAGIQRDVTAIKERMT